MKTIIPLIILSSLSANAIAAIELPIDFTSSATTPAEKIAQAAETIYTRLNDIPDADRTVSQTQLLNTLDYLITNNPTLEEIAEVTRAISPKANSANTTVTRKTPGTVTVKGIGKRLSALRKQVKIANFSSAKTYPKPRNRSLFGIPSDWMKYNNPLDEGGLLDQRLSGFASGGVTVSKQSETGTEVGFSGGLQQLTLGADYRLTNTSFAGVAISLASGTVDLDNDNGKLDNTSQAFLLYGTHNLRSDWYVDATINFGHRQFELERNVEFTLGGTQTIVSANSAPDSDFTSISLGTGYDKTWNNGHSITFLGNFDYTQSNIDGFSETDAGGYNLAVGSQSIDSMQLSLGLEWRQSISSSYGVLLPQFSMNWVQEFETSSDAINAYFIADPNKTSIEYKSGNKDQGYLNLKLGTSMVMPRGLSFFAQYETQQFIDDYQQYTISLGGRKEF